MLVTLIVAIDRKRGIGKANTLPWRLSDDLKGFKNRTMGHHIIVGRKTFESIGRALPGRTMVIVSRNTDLSVDNCIVTSSLMKAIEYAASRGESECFVCGGAQIYEQALERADKIILTQVDADVEADTFFPEINLAEWSSIQLEHHDADDRNEYSFDVVELRSTKH